MKLLSKVVLGGLALVCCTASVRAQDGLSGDTVSAVVVYGDDKLVADNELSDTRIQALLDSLCTLDPAPSDLIRDLKLFQQIRRMDDAQMVDLIDSLFELDTVPYALVNEINLYASQLPTQADVDRSSVLAWSHTDHEPGTDLYGAWNTVNPNAYGPDLSARDTLFQLQLTDPGSGCGYTIPIPPIVTSRFGWRNGRSHNGVDLDLEVKDPVHAAFPGVVRFAGTCGGFGRLVVVRHYNGLETFYAHLHRINVSSGDVVDAGDVVGLGGSSGHSTGSHLHFETRFKGVPVDPSHIIDLSTGELFCDTLVLKRTRYSYVAYPKGTRFHTVQKGEHIRAIAELYGTSPSIICELNGITPSARLHVGQRLMVADVPERFAQVR